MFKFNLCLLLLAFINGMFVTDYNGIYISLNKSGFSELPLIHFVIQVRSNATPWLEWAHRTRGLSLVHRNLYLFSELTVAAHNSKIVTRALHEQLYVLLNREPKSVIVSGLKDRTLPQASSEFPPYQFLIMKILTQTEKISS